VRHCGCTGLSAWAAPVLLGALASRTSVLAQRSAADESKRTIRIDDVAPKLRTRLPVNSRTIRGFDDFIAALERRTLEREEAGEYEHLTYYLLQSTRFTKEERLEPAVSAYRFIEGLPPDERSRFLGEGEVYMPPRERIPETVLRRTRDLARALQGKPNDPRLAMFKDVFGASASPETTDERLIKEYCRTMKFLYRKEFLSRSFTDPQEREAYLASLYQRRGHSTDTQVEANFAVHTGLSVIRSRDHEPIDKVLIIGPGLDLAPRTDFLETLDPQSYQPFLVADALLELGLSDSARLKIHCVDINDRVVRHLARLDRDKPIRLQVVSGLKEREDRTWDQAYRDYFRRLGTSIGEEEPWTVLEGLKDRLSKSLLVHPEIVRQITADHLNILTQRYTPSPSYDLILVTNVFSYFDPAEQALALSNVEAMLRAGGYFLHNEPQLSVVSAAETLGLPMTDARTVLIASSKEAPLFDRVAIHRKAPSSKQ